MKRERNTDLKAVRHRQIRRSTEWEKKQKLLDAQKCHQWKQVVP